ncbi:MAG TPA: carboxypeptidase-like regulatory domain-containing protein, partial [Nitrosospira sp.]
MKCLQRPALFLLMLCLVSGKFLSAQTASTSLQGTVTDASGGAVVGAAISLVDSESKTERTAVTGSQGEYRFLFLSPGTFTLTVTAKGFVRYEQTGL